MKRKLFTLLTLVILASLVLTACGANATPTGTPAATGLPATGEPAGTLPPAVEKTAIIGFTASLTGKLNVESTCQNNGLKLWMDQINAAGGVRLTNGTVITFEAKSYDDESSTDRAKELFTRLAVEDKADFLISPYSSGLTGVAAAIAEQNSKIMITTGAASDDTYKQGYTLVYQTYTPASRYLTGALDLLAGLDPNAKKIAIVHENDTFSTSVVESLKAYAESKGYEVVLYEGYDTGTTDFTAVIDKITAAVPDAIMGGGHYQDGSALARQLYDKGVKVKFLSLLVAPPEPTFAELGDAALGVIGPSQWEPLAAFTPRNAATANLELYGPTGAEFVAAYKAALGEEPSYHAAGGYVAGLILQKAIETAGSLDVAAVKTALDSMDMMTFFGHIKFDTTAEAHGLQIGHEMVYIQWQKDANNALIKQVVWPTEAATAPALYPIP